MTNQQRLEQTRQNHRANLLKTLEKRLEIAKASGKSQLVNQLEAERRYYLS